MNDDTLRLGLLELLDMGSAHATLERAVGGLTIPAAFRRVPAPRSGEQDLHSVWELLEHMRIAQEDILRYTMDPSWRSPSFPEGLWPTLSADLPATSEEELERLWNQTHARFRADLEEIRGWVRDTGLDLTMAIPHGEGRTYLRQVLLVADHNAYHLGQIVSVRRLLGSWREG